jgi:plasmid stabilization system protein ParE
MTIKFTKKAKQRLTEILNYSLQEFGANVSLRFAVIIDEDLLVLASNPYIGRKEDMVHLQTPVFYRPIQGVYEYCFHLPPSAENPLPEREVG